MGKKRRGRPPKYVIHPANGVSVYGLSMDANGYYYSFWRGEKLQKRPHFGPPGVESFKEAYDSFLAFMIQHKGGKFDLIETQDFAPNPQSIKIEPGTQVIEWSEISSTDTTAEPALIQEVFNEVTGERLYRIREDVKWKIVEQAIRKTPKLAAEKTGIEELSYLKDLTPPPPSLTLQEVGEFYFSKKYNDKGEPIKPKTIYDAKNWWKEFCKIVKTKTIRDIISKDVRRYNDHIHDEARKREGWRRYIRNRFYTINTIVNNIRGTENRLDKLNLKEILNEELTLVGEPKPNPQPILPKHYRAFLGATEKCEDAKKWKAILLLAGNGGFTPVDFTYLKKEAILWKEKMIIMERQKTNVDRQFLLWDRTLNALREYYNTGENNGSPYVFVNRYGKPYTANSIGKYWRERLKPYTRIRKDAQFSHIKDAVQTESINLYHCDPIAVCYVLGHEVRKDNTKAASATRSYLPTQFQLNISTHRRIG